MSDKIWIAHYGVKGMHWGVRKDGKPQGFQYGGKRHKKLVDKYTKAGLSKEEAEAAALRKRKIERAIAIGAGISLAALGGYAVYKHFNNPLVKDFVLRKGAKVQTISDFADRYKVGDHVYAAVNKIDKARYISDLEKEFKIQATLNKNSKIASVKKSEEIFSNLYNENKSFRDGVDFRLSQGGSKSGLEYLKKMSISDKYRNFNYHLTDRDIDVNNNRVVPKEVSIFFKEMKNKGYHGIIDTNDVAGLGPTKFKKFGSSEITIENYGFGTKKPIVFFDTDIFKNVSSSKITLEDMSKAERILTVDTVKQIIKDNTKESLKYVAPGGAGLAITPILYYTTYDQNVINKYSKKKEK